MQLDKTLINLWKGQHNYKNHTNTQFQKKMLQVISHCIIEKTKLTYRT